MVTIYDKLKRAEKLNRFWVGPYRMTYSWARDFYEAELDGRVIEICEEMIPENLWDMAEPEAERWLDGLFGVNDSNDLTLEKFIDAMRAAETGERPSLSVAAHAAGVRHPLQAVHDAAAKHSLMSAEAEYQRLLSTMSLADYDTWCVGEPDEIVIEHFVVIQCPDCNGSGRYVGCYVDNEPCRTCGGSKEAKRRL